MCVTLLVDVTYMPYLVGIFVSGTYLAITCEVKVAVCCVLAYIYIYWFHICFWHIFDYIGIMIPWEFDMSDSNVSEIPITTICYKLQHVGIILMEKCYISRIFLSMEV